MNYCKISFARVNKYLGWRDKVNWQVCYQTDQQKTKNILELDILGPKLCLAMLTLLTLCHLSISHNLWKDRCVMITTRDQTDVVYKVQMPGFMYDSYTFLCLQSTRQICTFLHLKVLLQSHKWPISSLATKEDYKTFTKNLIIDEYY